MGALELRAEHQLEMVVPNLMEVASVVSPLRVPDHLFGQSLARGLRQGSDRIAHSPILALIQRLQRPETPASRAGGARGSDSDTTAGVNPATLAPILSLSSCEVLSSPFGGVNITRACMRRFFE